MKSFVVAALCVLALCVAVNAQADQLDCKGVGTVSALIEEIVVIPPNSTTPPEVLAVIAGKFSINMKKGMATFFAGEVVNVPKIFTVGLQIWFDYNSKTQYTVVNGKCTSKSTSPLMTDLKIWDQYTVANQVVYSQSEVFENNGNYTLIVDSLYDCFPVFFNIERTGKPFLPVVGQFRNVLPKAPLALVPIPSECNSDSAKEVDFDRAALGPQLSLLVDAFPALVAAAGRY